jgi:hypothetical protein
MRRGGGAGVGDANSDIATGGSAVTHDVRPASHRAAQALRARDHAGGGSRIGTAAPNLDRLISMVALAALRLVLARSAEAGAHTPASFSQTGHMTAAQLEDRRTNPAAATFAFLLDSGAVVGRLVTADAARCDPTLPAAVSSDPAELPPNTQKYHTWLLSNVGDPATVHDSQEAYRHAMRQPGGGGGGRGAAPPPRGGPSLNCAARDHQPPPPPPPSPPTAAPRPRHHLAPAPPAALRQRFTK